MFVAISKIKVFVDLIVLRTGKLKIHFSIIPSPEKYYIWS